MIAVVSTTEQCFDLLIRRVVEGVGRSRAIHCRVDTSQRHVETFIADDPVERVYDVTIISTRVWHQYLHSCLQSHTNLADKYF